MNNPYIILNIEQTATDEEIEQARKIQLKLHCSKDENIKDKNGEYLSDIINKAADNLLNKERRKEIDERLNNTKNVPAIYFPSQYPSQVILTNINKELIQEKEKIVIKKFFFDKKVKCNKLFVGVLSNNSCVYLIENSYYDEECEVKIWYFYEYFTGRTVSEGFSEHCPWDESEVFKINGLLAFAYPAYQVIPNELIRNGMISENTLRSILPIFQQVLANNTDELNQLFNEEKVKVHKK